VDEQADEADDSRNTQQREKTMTTAHGAPPKFEL
jgi:hypothetical protein